MRCTRNSPRGCSRKRTAGRWWKHRRSRQRRYQRERPRRRSISNRSWGDTGGGGTAGPPFLFADLPHVGVELVVLVLHGIEKQALAQVGLTLFIGHLADQVVD